jgi:Protein of unknown function (DUF3574)
MRLAAVALASGLAIGTAHAQATSGSAGIGACPGSARPMVRLELLFGMSRPGGRVVSEAEWIEFLETEVIARFPAGLTVLSGLGHWQSGAGGFTREQSKVVLIWHEPDDGAEARIEAIRSAYKRLFAQESVMRVESTACVSF